MSQDGGVDRTQIAHRFALSPAERVGMMADEVRTLLTLGERSAAVR